MGAQKNRLIETVLLSTHNICFGWEMRILFFCYALLTKGLFKVGFGIPQHLHLHERSSFNSLSLFYINPMIVWLCHFQHTSSRVADCRQNCIPHVDFHLMWSSCTMFPWILRSCARLSQDGRADLSYSIHKPNMWMRAFTIVIQTPCVSCSSLAPS